MLQQAYGEDYLSRRPCHEWYQRFGSDRTSIEDDPKSGRSSTSVGDDRVEKVLTVIRKNVHLKFLQMSVCKCLVKHLSLTLMTTVMLSKHAAKGKVNKICTD